MKFPKPTIYDVIFAVILFLFFIHSIVIKYLKP